MYQEKLVLAIKSNGKILREFKDSVRLPFGSEFSLFIKNLNTLRCLVTIQIDGADIADGDRFVVPANSSIDIERFLKAGNKERGNRFKFIERTKKIEDGQRGIRSDDGLVRIEFEFERLQDIFQSPFRPVLSPQWPTTVGSLPTGFTCDLSPFSSNQQINCASSTQDTINKVPEVNNETGITVAGSVSDQKFFDTAWFPTDGIKHVMIIKLVGEIGQTEIKNAVTVKTKNRCSTCDHINGISAKFCSECGTGLIIV